MVIDAHQHFWKLDLPFDYGWLKAPKLAKINRNREPETLFEQMRASGVDRSVFVQTQHHLDETRWALGLTDRYPWIAGVVGWVDLVSDDCEQQLLEFKQHPRFVGVRHLAQDEEDDDFIIRPEVIRGLRVLEKHRVPFDLLLRVRHLKHVPRLVNELPDLPMVIDHLAKPEIEAGHISSWRHDLRAAAAAPNVYCKLSGMVTEADWAAWQPEDLEPYVAEALNCFGAERCMFGSDWPVCELAASYREVVETLRSLLAGLSSDELDAVFCRTAASVYGLACE